MQTLLPFDVNHTILESLKKTNRIIFVDEDVPGGAAGYMFNIVMEKQGGYRWLDTARVPSLAKLIAPVMAATAIISANPMLKRSLRTLIMEMMKE